LEATYHRWKDKVEFLTVYVREAHPIGDRPATPTNAAAGILIKQPTTLDERRLVADRCSTALALTTPIVVDEIDNRVARAYNALPDRLYVIDRQGCLAYRGARGPFGFNPAEMEQALALVLLEQNSEPTSPLPRAESAK
jgi:hypothetical protein